MKSSPILMTKVVLFLIFLMLWGQAATAQTIISIQVDESGNALWTVEKHIPFTTQSEINEWEIILKDQGKYRYKKDITEFSDSINKSLLSAENYSNRSMRAENFNISYDIAKTPQNSYGITRFSFEWENFSRVESSRILIGDSFPGGMVLSSDNVLVIEIPHGYDVVNASPGFDKRDGDRLIWDGTLYRSFSEGEPSLVLSRTVINHDTYPANVVNFYWVLAVILISGTSLVVWKRRRSQSRKDGAVLTHNTKNEVLQKRDIEAGAVETGDTGAGIVQTDKPGDEAAAQIENIEIATSQADDAGINTNPADSIKTESVESDVSQPPLSYLPEEFLGDEEMIERYLKKCGGQAYQSDIVKDSGLSKSKISIVLAKMKEDGQILKIKKGKENIIRLAVKTE